MAFNSTYINWLRHLDPKSNLIMTNKKEKVVVELVSQQSCE